MCHGYEARWWRSETAAGKKIKDVVGRRADRQEIETKAEEKVEEKELVPAE